MALVVKEDEIPGPVILRNKYYCKDRKLAPLITLWSSPMPSPASAAANPNANMSMSLDAKAKMRATEKAVYRYYNDMGKSKGHCSWGAGILAHKGVCSAEDHNKR